MRTMIVVGCVVLGFQGAGLCEPPPSVPSVPKEMKEQQERMQRQYEQMQQEELERLKQMDPKLYQERQAALQRQEKIRAILEDFHQGKLTDTQAENHLFPLLKQEMAPELSAVEAKLKRLENQVEFLRDVKKNPDVLVKKRLDQMLGRSMPTPEEGMGW